jgi:hypothetical protein
MKLGINIVSILWYLFVIPGIAAFSNNIPSTYTFVILFSIPPIGYLLAHLYSKRNKTLFVKTILYVLFFILFLILSSYFFEVVVSEKYGYSIPGLFVLIAMYVTPILLIKLHHEFSLRNNTNKLIHLTQGYLKSEISFEDFSKKFEKLYNSGYEVQYFKSLFSWIDFRLENESEEWLKKISNEAGILEVTDFVKDEIELIQSSKRANLVSDFIHFNDSLENLIERDSITEYSGVSEKGLIINKEILNNIINMQKGGEISMNDLVEWSTRTYHDFWSFDYETDENVYDLLRYMANPEVTYSFDQEKLESLLSFVQEKDQSD